MDRILGHILRRAVWERLDLLDDLASRADAGSLASVAGTELPRLTNGWRALLAEHEPDSEGRCPQCAGRFWRRQEPCSVWRVAHEVLLSTDDPTPAVH